MFIYSGLQSGSSDWTPEGKTRQSQFRCVAPEGSTCADVELDFENNFLGGNLYWGGTNIGIGISHIHVDYGGSKPDRTVEFTVDVEYKTQTLAEQDVMAFAPLDRPPVISYRSKEVPDYAVYNYDGTPVVNTAKEKIDPPPPIMSAQFQIVCRKNYSLESWNPKLAKALLYKLNANPMLGFNERELQLVGLTADQDQEEWRGQGYKFMTVEWVFNTDDVDNFDILLQSVGLTCFQLSTDPAKYPINQFAKPVRINCKNSDGTTATEPRPLDVDGCQVQETPPGVPNAFPTATIHVKPWAPVDFSFFGLT